MLLVVSREKHGGLPTVTQKRLHDPDQIVWIANYLVLSVVSAGETAAHDPIVLCLFLIDMR